MPAAQDYKNLKATDVDELGEFLYQYARDGENLIGTANRLVMELNFLKGYRQGAEEQMQELAKQLVAALDCLQYVRANDKTTPYQEREPNALGEYPPTKGRFLTPRALADLTLATIPRPK